MINLSAVKPHDRNKQTFIVFSNPQHISRLLDNKSYDKNPNRNISAWACQRVIFAKMIWKLILAQIKLEQRIVSTNHCCSRSLKLSIFHIFEFCVSLQSIFLKIVALWVLGSPVLMDKLSKNLTGTDQGTDQFGLERHLSWQIKHLTENIISFHCQQ